MAKNDRYPTPIDEVVDRMRRVETRLTVYLESRGFDTQTARPVFDGVSVVLPNISTKLNEILHVVSTYEEVSLELNGKTVAYLRKA